jgi:AsmA protein
MPLKRRHARIPAAIALVAVAAFAILWVGARTPYARGLIAGAIGEAVGLPATIGRLRIGFFPSPRLGIDDLSIAQPPGYGDEPLLEAERIEVVLPWRRIYGATDRISSLAASNATVRLRLAADGTGNWSTLFPEPPAGSAPAEPVRWSLGEVALEGAAVDFRDAATGSQWQLTAISATASEVAPGTAFPVDLKLAGLAGPNTMHFALNGEARMDLDAGRYEADSLDFRGWLGGEPLPLAGAELTGTLREASYDSGTGTASFAGGQFRFAEIPGRFGGRLDLDEPALVAEIDVATEAFAPRAPAIILGQPLPVTADPVAFESLQAVFRVRMRDGELALDPLSGRLDDTNFEGQVIPGRRFVRASLDAIDFNRYLPPAAKPAGTGAKKATLESLVAELAKLDVDAEVKIGEARIGGAKMRDAVIRITPDGKETP